MKRVIFNKEEELKTMLSSDLKFQSILGCKAKNNRKYFLLYNYIEDFQPAYISNIDGTCYSRSSQTYKTSIEAMRFDSSNEVFEFDTLKELLLWLAEEEI